MAVLSDRVVEKFCGTCAWVYEIWAMRRTLFDDNPTIETLMKGKHGAFRGYLSTVTQEYVLHQWIKLHDPAQQGKSTNLSLEYVEAFGGWDSATMSRLRELRGRLDSLAVHVRSARNKVLSHNDLAAMLKGEPLGAFPENADRSYFAALQEFVDVVHDRTIGGPFPFPNHVITDVHLLLAALAAPRRSRDLTARGRTRVRGS